MFKTALRNVLSHKGRLLMTMLAVVLGTAFVAGTLVFSDSVSTALQNSMSHTYDNVSVRVDDQASGSERSAKNNNSAADPLTTQTLQRISALPGAASAVGTAHGFAGIADPQGRLIGERGNTSGANWSPAANGGGDTRYPMTQGSGPADGTQVAIDEKTAEKNGFKVGDTVRVAVNGPVMQLTVSGLFTTDDPQVSSGGSLVLFDTATAQKLYAKAGQFSAIDVTAKPGVGQSALEDQVLQVIPHSANITVHTGADLAATAKQDIKDGMASMRTAMLFFAGIALFVGIFLISNTFTMLIAQRTRELALMRALGASRKQVRRSVVLEALLVGFSASVVGLGAGVGIGAALKAWAGSSGNIPSGGLTVTASTALITLLVGTVVTAAAALFPALRASRVPPVAAMSSGDQPASQKSLVVRNSIGGVLAGLGVAAVLLGVDKGGSDGRMPVALGAMLVLLGVFVLTPLLSRPIIAIAGPLFGRLFGVSGKLAKQNAVRNPRRTAATASALTIGVTLIAALTVIGTSVSSAVTGQVTANMKADYAVSAELGLPTTKALVDQIKSAKGVTATSVIDEQYLRADGKDLNVSGFDAGSFDQLVAPVMKQGSTASLAQGQLLIDADRASSLNLSVGSTVTIGYPNGSTGTLTVGGIYEKSDLLGPALLGEQTLAPHTTAPYVTDVLVKSDGGATAANEQALRDATGLNPLIKVQSQQQMIDHFNSTITLMLTILYALLGMAVLIAVLGVVNTLAMSVFERKRELGMLRAVGLDKRGVKRMVRLEAVVIALFGAGMGIAVGTFLAWAANRLLRADMANLTTVLPWGQLALFLATGAAVGLLAAMWPARSAARLDILGAIKTD